MFAKILAAAALVAAPVPASAPEMVFAAYPGVYKVSCDEGSGTAFRVSPRHFLSVAHVTAMHGCEVDGAPIKVTEQNTDLDFSQFDAVVPGPNLRISCEGYHAGEWVWSFGFAGGKPFLTGVALYTTYAKDQSGKRVFIGHYAVIPGMSGGAIFNSRGYVVGVVNAYVPGQGISFSRDLRDTSVCEHATGAY